MVESMLLIQHYTETDKYFLLDFLLFALIFWNNSTFLHNEDKGCDPQLHKDL